VASRQACILESMVPDLGRNIGYSGSGYVVFLIAIIKPEDYLEAIYDRYSLPLLQFTLQSTLSCLDDE
jgi:hypothetical protein